LEVKVDNIRGTYIVINSSLVKITDFEYTLSKKNVYEVIRVIDGVPLFLEEHLERMNQSIGILKMNFTKSKEEISNLIHLLAKKNRIKDGNLKILINDGPTLMFYLYFIPHFYPDKASYIKGIKTRTMKIERKNPNAKVIDPKYKSAVSDFIEENNIYEALLLNSDDEITEGSKSNVFFVIGHSLYTPPLKDVLGGVTRKRIIDIAKELDMNVSEETLHLKDLSEIEAAFISGTSPKILPIASIDSLKLKSSENPMVKKLISAYDLKIKSYIEKNK